MKIHETKSFHSTVVKNCTTIASVNSLKMKFLKVVSPVFFILERAITALVLNPGYFFCYRT